MRAPDIQLTVIEITCPTNQFASTVDLKVIACRDISYSEDPRVRLKVCETTGAYNMVVPDMEEVEET